MNIELEEYPDRHRKHVMETTSMKILNNKIPDRWVLRGATERDYGIDLYLEIVGADNKITGELMALQVKSKESIVFGSDGKYTLSGIKKSTLNYWKGLPVPVFVVVVDLTGDKAYWLNLGEYLRTNQIPDGQDSFSLYFTNKRTLESGSDNFAFVDSYKLERKWPTIEKAIVNSITLYPTLGPFVLYCRRNFIKRPLSSTLQFFLINHYENFLNISYYIPYPDRRNYKQISVWYEKHAAESKDGEPRPTFSFELANEMIEYFIDQYLDAIEWHYKRFSAQNNDYWKARYPYLTNLYNERPIEFNSIDWYPRYYFDEYESETHNLLECFLEDLIL